MHIDSFHFGIFNLIFQFDMPCLQLSRRTVSQNVVSCGPCHCFHGKASVTLCNAASLQSYRNRKAHERNFTAMLLRRQCQTRLQRHHAQQRAGRQSPAKGFYDMLFASAQESSS